MLEKDEHLPAELRDAIRTGTTEIAWDSVKKKGYYAGMSITYRPEVKGEKKKPSRAGTARFSGVISSVDVDNGTAKIRKYGQSTENRYGYKGEKLSDLRFSDTFGTGESGKREMDYILKEAESTSAKSWEVYSALQHAPEISRLAHQDRIRESVTAVVVTAAKSNADHKRKVNALAGRSFETVPPLVFTSDQFYTSASGQVVYDRAFSPDSGDKLLLPFGDDLPKLANYLADKLARKSVELGRLRDKATGYDGLGGLDFSVQSDIPQGFQDGVYTAIYPLYKERYNALQAAKEA